MALTTLDDKSNTFTGGIEDDTIFGRGGDDVIHGSDGNDKIYGQDDVDTLYGDAGNDYLEAGPGTSGLTDPDELHGGEGDDTLVAGAGNTYGNYFGDAGKDTIVGSLFGDVEGGADGDDLTGTGGFIGSTLSYSQSSAGVTVDLKNNTATGGDATGDTIHQFANLKGSALGDTLRGTTTENDLSGLAGDDTIYGDNGNDAISGDDGDDKLFGGDGDDNLKGGDGADRLDGGDGIDTVDYRFTLAAVTINMAMNISSGGEAAGDTFKNIENIFGSSSGDDITGDDKANTLDGSDGANTLHGGGGNDTLKGGDFGAYADKLFGDDGSDTFYGDDGADELDGGKGTDTVDYSLSFDAMTIDLTGAASKGGDAEGDTLTLVENVSAGHASDTIIGNGAKNQLDGGSGDDTLTGGGGNDIVIGGSGKDEMDGGDGVDTASYSSSFTVIAADLTKHKGTLGDADGDILKNIENLIGGSGGDTLTGDGGKNSLDGSWGSDTLTGGSGNDFLDGGGDGDRLIGGRGADTLFGDFGADSFVFTSIKDSAVAAKGQDTIQDFTQSDFDKIDLKAIDADTKAGGDQAFDFIGSDDFSKTAGELRYVKKPSDTFIYGDVNGDGKADFVIHLDDAVALAKGDFVL